MSVTKKVVQEVIVSGEGERKTEAFASALNQVSKKILKESDDVLLRIEPKNVLIQKAEERQFTERFLFLFFPRKRTVYYVELTVEVEISLIHMGDVSFQTVQTKDPQGIRLPFVSKKN